MKKKLVLEVNNDIKKSNDTFEVGNSVVMITPDINEDYFLFRVKLHKDQSIVAFPKFGIIGIGFAQEIDWNTNLPSNCDAEKIYNHIKCNKKYKEITKANCIIAIKMVQNACDKYKK